MRLVWRKNPVKMFGHPLFRFALWSGFVFLSAGFVASCGASPNSATGIGIPTGTSFSVSFVGHCDAPAKGECYFFNPENYGGTASNYTFSGTLLTYSVASNAATCTGTRTSFSTGTSTSSSTGTSTSTSASSGTSLCPPYSTPVDACAGSYAGHCTSNFSGSSGGGTMVMTSTSVWTTP